jgi:hypothetical protein
VSCHPRSGTAASRRVGGVLVEAVQHPPLVVDHDGSHPGIAFADSLVVLEPTGAAAAGSPAPAAPPLPYSPPAAGLAGAGVLMGAASGTVVPAALLCGDPAARMPHPASASAVSTPQARYAARPARITSPPWCSHGCQVSGG